MSYYLDHEKLDVYHFAIQFVVLADEIVESLPRGRAYLVDQLRRAGSSIPLNIAEGAGGKAFRHQVFEHLGYTPASEAD